MTIHAMRDSGAMLKGEFFCRVKSHNAVSSVGLRRRQLVKGTLRARELASLHDVVPPEIRFHKGSLAFREKIRMFFYLRSPISLCLLEDLRNDSSIARNKRVVFFVISPQQAL